MDQLHKSGGGVDLSSDTCLFGWQIYRDTTVFIGITIISIVGTCVLWSSNGHFFS